MIEVATGNNKNIASVRRTGSMRDAATAETETFDEMAALVSMLFGALLVCPVQRYREDLFHAAVKPAITFLISKI